MRHLRVEDFGYHRVPHDDYTQRKDRHLDWLVAAVAVMPVDGRGLRRLDREQRHRQRHRWDWLRVGHRDSADHPALACPARPRASASPASAASPASLGPEGQPGPPGDPGPGSDPSISSIVPGKVYLERTLDVAISGFGTQWDSTRSPSTSARASPSTV